MQTIFVVQGLVGTLYLVTITAVAFRLLRMAWHSRAIPELLLGAGLLLGGTLGGPIEGVGMSSRADLGPALAGHLLLLGKVFALAGVACHACFICRVFRPGARWAEAFVAAIVALAVAGLAGHAVTGAFTTAEIPVIWFCVDLLGRVAVCGWLVIEGASYYHAMRRRMALGLADPLLTNRFLLWSLAGGFTIVVLLTSVPPLFLDIRENPLILTADLMIFSVAGACVSALYFLTFFPPPAYRRRVEEKLAVGR